MGKDVLQIGWQKLWPNLAGHKSLTGHEGHKRLDNTHRPGSVAHDLAGVQASQHSVLH
jgi:hypothetical protein